MNSRTKIVLKSLLFLLMIFSLPACQPASQPNEIQPEVAQPLQDAVVLVEEPADEAVVSVDGPADSTLVDDFENIELKTGKDIYAEIGFVAWSDGSEIGLDILEYDTDIAPPADLPDSKRGLALSVNIGSGGWAGMSHSFTNETLDLWISRDWSAYEGISFWVYGKETGGTMLFEILENRNLDSEVDDAERWNFTFYDDFSGWKHFEVPFTDFNRKDIGNGAPNDGLELVDVHGYAFGGFGAIEIGKQTYYLDDVRVYGVAPEKPLEFNLDKQLYTAREGGKGKITVELNKPAEEEIFIDFSITEGYAVLGQDFYLETGRLTFAPGETEAILEIQAIDDFIIEGPEQFVVTLHNPVGAKLGAFRRAVITIRDNESLDPNLLTNFESPPGLVASSDAELSLLPVLATDSLSFEGQIGLNTVLKVDAAGRAATFGRIFPAPEDWSGYDGIQLMVYGQNSGGRLAFDVLLEKDQLQADDLMLVWSDEFEGPAGQFPNFFVWKPELGDGKLNNLEGWGNAELEHYTGSPENAALDGAGNLVITAQKVDPDTSPLQCWYGPCEYTSARLITKDRVEFQYGRIEARIKLPVGNGLWPAFWMLGSNIDEVGWPQSGEIDIMEFIGSKPDRIGAALHGPGYFGAGNIGTAFVLEEGDFSEDFHVFAVEWSPGEIVWYLDDQPYHSVTLEDIPASGDWVFDQPGFIILNLAVGGHYPGNPDKTTPFPAEMVIDYVRVYQQPADYLRLTFTIVDDLEGWQQVQIPFADIQPSVDIAAFAEVWGYSFDLSDFGGSELYLDNFSFYIEE